MEEENINQEDYDLENLNGIVINNKFLPEEILTMILSYVDPKDLVFNCRRVCKTWCNIIDEEVWKIKFARKNLHFQKFNEFPWYICFWILTKNFLNRNLLKNGCGQDYLAHWEILSNGGNQWDVENPPIGTTGFPKESINEELQKSNSCFVTSYNSCSKKQIIDLKAEGAIPYFMDIFQPHITISEWFCGRFDCRSVYELKVTLLNENSESLDEFEIRKNVGGENGSSWEQINHVFCNYDTGVRFVEFFHGGMDSQFWAGHYGSKMTGATVTLSLP